MWQNTKRFRSSNALVVNCPKLSSLQSFMGSASSLAADRQVQSREVVNSSRRVAPCNSGLRLDAIRPLPILGFKRFSRMENFSYLFDSRSLWRGLWQVDSLTSVRYRYTAILAASYYIGLIHLRFWHFCNPLTISHLSWSPENFQYRRLKGNKITIEEKNLSFILTSVWNWPDERKEKSKENTSKTTNKWKNRKPELTLSLRN
jgi:hypothetical protein